MPVKNELMLAVGGRADGNRGMAITVETKRTVVHPRYLNNAQNFFKIALYIDPVNR
jgi:hypothetical protein